MTFNICIYTNEFVWTMPDKTVIISFEMAINKSMLSLTFKNKLE